MQNITKKELCEFLGTYCAMYRCDAYHIGARTPFVTRPDYLLSNIKYGDLQRGDIVNIRIDGANMKFGSLSNLYLENKYEQCEILRVANVDDARITLFAPHYLPNSKIASNLDFGQEYRSALEHDKLQSVRLMHSLIPRAAAEKDKWIKGDTKKLAKELGMQEHMSDKRLRAALAMAAAEIVDKHSFNLWEGEQTPQFMLTCESYNDIIKELYELTYEKLQIMQIAEQTHGLNSLQQSDMVQPTLDDEPELEEDVEFDRK